MILIETFFSPSLAQTVDETVQQNITALDGQILFAPMDSTKTYLIDRTGTVNHTWSSNFFPGVGVHWIDNGTILRTIRVGLGPGTGGAGGGVQKVTWDGTILWEFRYNTNGHLSHHDVLTLPNGNVLMIAWETTTRDEAIEAGRNPSSISTNGLYPDHIIEVHPTGSTSGTIVWEWHVWDHLVQDYDSSKANYGDVSDHPELVDLNYQASSSSDWMHTNSIEYNEEFDQILISVCHFSEIWFIDHSTTTVEAASHSGGTSGKGGDLLYRWGNPAAYQAGTTNDQKLFEQHDASWIDEGCPGAGNILIFNNQAGQLSRYSSVDEIVPPVNDNGEYYLASGSSYGPTAQTWRYTASPPTSFYSGHLGGAERLTDGSTLICSGEPGVFFQITTAGTSIWTYKNIYPGIATNNVFNIDYVPSDTESSNQPPYPPRNPYPANGTTASSVKSEVSWTGGDPNSNDIITYDVYFGTNSTPSKVSTAQSDASYNPGVLSNGITYYWRIVAWDNNGLSTLGPLWHFTTLSEENNPPNTPVINGETNGNIRTTYFYTVETTDPEKNEVKYYIDWDDNTTTTTGLYESGEEVYVSHTWTAEGFYTIKVKAIDEYSAESTWGTLAITMPYSMNNPLQQLFQWLFQQFPNTFSLLQQLMGY